MRRIVCAWALVGSAMLLISAVLTPSPVLAQSGNVLDETPAAPRPVTNPIKGLNKDPEPAFQEALADSVFRRPRVEYNPIGLEVGGITGDITDLGRGQLLESFLLFPKVDFELEFNDNVFAEERAKVADFIGTIKPQLTLVSDWDNHRFFITAKGEFRKHLSEGAEDYYRYGLSTGGTIQVTEFETVGITLSFDRKTQDRGEPDAGLFGVEPTVFRDFKAQVDWKYQRDKFLWNPKVSLTYSDFDDVDNGQGGVIDKDENDRWALDASLRLGYEAWKGTTLFVEPRLIAVRHDQNVANNGLKRDFLTTALVAGLTYDLTAVSYLEAGLVASLSRFDDASRDNQRQFSPSLELVWNPHDSWTFAAGYQRSVQSTNDPATNAITRDLFVAEAELEIMYNLLAANRTSWTRDDSVGNGNIDNLVTNTAEIKWLMNENAQLRGFWNFTTLRSDTATKEFDRNRLGVVLTVHY